MARAVTPTSLGAVRLRLVAPVLDAQMLDGHDVTDFRPIVAATTAGVSTNGKPSAAHSRQLSVHRSTK
ncbi:hypothetical protein O7626_39730 [Micromonospora sp. WMMD1102]|uniref:hypothetical protein n=1 Tax=Micromonospora sp. WMMD1102 TaxID=3016105 RepID=UPI002414F143|nr:hypothetical protein [Micromonospora sp. WMMD1102]MDG4791946.1 hypothetical protein [Micromonospora sp. WMMD1102]